MIQWCKKCIWGNLLPQWKHDLGSVEKISSGDFVSLRTQRINHLANRYSVAQGRASISPPPKTHARRLTTVAAGNFRALGFMRDSFAVLSHSLGASFLFIQLPPLRRAAAVEPQRCLQSRVKRSRRPPGERRLVRSARKDG